MEDMSRHRYLGEVALTIKENSNARLLKYRMLTLCQIRCNRSYNGISVDCAASEVHGTGCRQRSDIFCVSRVPCCLGVGFVSLARDFELDMVLS